MKYADLFHYAQLKQLTEAARGMAECDLVITNARIVDTITETTAFGEIWVDNGIIVHVERDNTKFGNFNASEVYDAGGNYVAPGLMDSHVHIESSMLSPYYFGRAVVVHGTTSVFTDPHEICNVAGREGIRYMYDNSCLYNSIRQFMLIPSCVPAVPGRESAGAKVSGNDVEYITSKYQNRIVGLAEVMDYPGVIHGDQRMADILHAARAKHLYIQGHYSGIHGNDLSAYLAAGIGGNHEIRDAEDMAEVIRAGGWVDMCGSSSIADRLDNLLPALKMFPNPSVLPITVCTDDVHAADLLDPTHGHINKVVARIIASGIAPETAIAYATRNIAQEYGIENLGAIKAGNLADFIVFDSFETIEPIAVFIDGEQQVADGKIIEEADPNLARPDSPHKLMIMRIPEAITPEMLIPKPPHPNGSEKKVVNVINFDGLYTKLEQETIPLTTGVLDLSDRDDLCFIAVLNRYGTNTVSLGVLKGFGLKRGAVATTVSHDSHNLTLIYKNPVMAANLANQLIKCAGGIAAGLSQNDFSLVELPIGGLMSYLSAEELTPQIQAVEAQLSRLFYCETSLLKTAILTLPVVPEVRVTDIGIVDVGKQEFVPLFPEQ